MGINRCLTDSSQAGLSLFSHARYSDAAESFRLHLTWPERDDIVCM